MRELLKLYDLKDTPETRAIIDSVTGIGYRRATARAPHADFAALCRGVDIDLVMDPERAGAMGIYLPSAVLERFFALYTSINSFTRLTVRAKGRKEALVRWGARIGAKVTA
nr:type VI secretion system baseplate subunit TssF [Nitrospirillum amazonense]